MTSRVAARALALLCVAVPAASQDVRGTVRDSANGVPLTGVVVMTLDATGRQYARTLTDSRGQYILPRAASATSVRALRIGFRPRDVAIPTPGSAVTDVAMEMLPRFLERVVATANPQCPRRGDSEVAFGLWEQAQAALLATVVARESNPARSTIAVAQRLFHKSRDSITEQRVRIDSGRHANSFFASQPPGDYVKWGFVIQDKQEQNTFYVPDADVLLSQPFQRAYCLSIAGRDRARPMQVGLRFTRPDQERPRVDIDATLWIDTAARVMRDIDFKYAGLETGADRHRPGGSVQFHAMPNGIVMVNEWSLRMVSREIDTTAKVYVSPGGQDIRGISRGVTPGEWGDTDMKRARPFVVTEQVGELVRASWTGDVAYQTRLGAIRIKATLSNGQPAVGVRVQLDSTDYAGTTDSTGTVELRDLLPGPYRAIVHDSTLAVVGLHMRTPVWFTAVRDASLERAFVLGTAAEILAQGCGDLRYGGAYHLLIARVTSSRGAPLSGINWSIGPAQQPGSTITGRPITGTTKGNGIIEPCGRYEPGSEVELRLWTEQGQFTQLSPRIVRTRLMHRAHSVAIEMPR